nr:MAG TPA: hypothetical protein [Caudoviricetes sp.]
MKIWVLFGTKTAAHDLDGLNAALDTGGKLAIQDGVGEDKIHFLGGPLTLGVARRLLIVIAAVVVAGERVETGRHEGSGSAPCWIWVFAKLGDFLFENRWSTNLCKYNSFVSGNKLAFTGWI